MEGGTIAAVLPNLQSDKDGESETAEKNDLVVPTIIIGGCLEYPRDTFLEKGTVAEVLFTHLALNLLLDLTFVAFWQFVVVYYILPKFDPGL